MPLVEEERKVPSFSLKDQNGKVQRLADYASRHVVLYFHPKDATPGCTKEASTVCDNLPRFKGSKVAVLSVSILDEASKAWFAAKYGLTFPLCSPIAITPWRTNTEPGRRNHATVESTRESCGRRT